MIYPLNIHPKGLPARLRFHLAASDCGCSRCTVLREAAAAIEAHDARVTELLEANNREVERRRAAENYAEKLKAALSVMTRKPRLFPPRMRLPG